MKKNKFAEVNLGNRIYLARNESGARKGENVEIMTNGEHGSPFVVGVGRVIGTLSKIDYPQNEGGYYWV